MIIFESGISSPLSSMYGIWPLLPNFMVNTFSYLHCTCIVYIWLFQKFKLILSYWLTNLMPASRSQVSSLRANGEIVRTGKELFENYWIVGLLYYYYCLFTVLLTIILRTGKRLFDIIWKLRVNNFQNVWAPLFARKNQEGWFESDVCVGT